MWGNTPHLHSSCHSPKLDPQITVSGLKALCGQAANPRPFAAGTVSMSPVCHSPRHRHLLPSLGYHRHGPPRSLCLSLRHCHQELTGLLFCAHFSVLTNGTPSRPASPEGVCCNSQELWGQLPGLGKAFKALGSLSRAPPPCLLPLAFQPAVSIRAGAGLSVLADSSKIFLAEKRTAHQDHIPDVGMEIWEG